MAHQRYVMLVRSEQLSDLKGALEFASLRGSKQDRALAKLLAKRIPTEVRGGKFPFEQVFLSPKEARLVEDVISALTTLKIDVSRLK